MAAITNEMIHSCYALAQKVYEEKLSLKSGLDNLVTDYQMNRNSASDYLHNYACMLEGRRFSRTNNAYGTKYFLRNMLQDGGRTRLLNALSALRQHIDYYEAIGNSKLHKQRAIFEEFSAIANISKIDIFPDEVEESDESLLEGKTRKVNINIYERNPVARQQCIEHYGCKCFICEFDFGSVYGKMGEGFIHVHHLVEISTIGSTYSVDPIKDLRPVCPNCHAMLHKRKPAYSIEDVVNNLTGKAAPVL